MSNSAEQRRCQAVIILDVRLPLTQCGLQDGHEGDHRYGEFAWPNSDRVNEARAQARTA